MWSESAAARRRQARIEFVQPVELVLELLGFVRAPVQLAARPREGAGGEAMKLASATRSTRSSSASKACSSRGIAATRAAPIRCRPL